MKVYILTDMEGVAGIVSRDQVGFGNPGYDRARDWLTADVNASVKGAIEAGATQVVVRDGHGANNANNIRYENIHPAAELIQGAPAVGILPFLDKSFDCLIQIGAHAMSGTPGAILEHTENSTNWVEMTINGKPTGEIGLIAAAAGHYGVPFVMVSGDDKACEEARLIVPDVQTAVVKYGITRHCAKLLPREKVDEAIFNATLNAIQKANDIAPFVMGSPTVIEIEYLRTETLDRLSERDGVTKLSARRVRFEGHDIIEAVNRWLGG